MADGAGGGGPSVRESTMFSCVNTNANTGSTPSTGSKKRSGMDMLDMIDTPEKVECEDSNY